MISMFNETYGGVKKKAEEEWRLTWGQAILRGERRLRLVLPLRLQTWLSIDDIDEDGCAYVFQRVDVAKYQSQNAKGKIGKVQDWQTRDDPKTVVELRAALQNRDTELARLRAELALRDAQLNPRIFASANVG